MSILSDANRIINAALHAALPDVAVEQALENLPPCSGKMILIAAKINSPAVL